MTSRKLRNNKTRRPPIWARWLISKLSLYETHHSALGDLEETFYGIINQKGIIRARLWYSVQTLRSFSSYLNLVLALGFDLLVNYTKVAIRNLRRHKGYTAINILGMAIGLAAVFLIILFICYEVSFDRHHEHASRIHRIVSEDYVGTPYILGDTLKKQVPGIEEIVRLKDLNMFGPIMLNARDKKFREEALYMADASIFKVFSFKFRHGSPETALADPLSIVLTESAAQRYFGRDNPLGEIILHGDDLPFQVTAVIADLPSTSHFHFNVLISTAHAARFSWGVDDRTSWTSFNYLTYILLFFQTSPSEILEKASQFVNSHREKSPRLLIQRLLDIHLYSHLRMELRENGDIRYLRIYATVGIIILLLACINFMNLGSARSFNRGSEVGIRKILGAQRKQIVRQFIGEAILVALLAAGVAVIITQLTLPFFRRLSGREFSWGSVPLIMLIPALFAIVMLTGIIAGCYPAFFASSFQPLRVLRGAPKLFTRRFPLRNFLVGMQFVVSVLFIGCTLFIINQMHYLKNHKLGIDKERIIYIRLPDEARGESEAIKTELLRHSSILKVTASNFLPSGTTNRIKSDWDGRLEKEDTYLWQIAVDYDFISTFGIEIIEGDGFLSRHVPGSTFIVNQSAAKEIGGPVIGKTLNMSGGGAQPGKIIGIVRDFHFRSLHHSIEPLVLFLDVIRSAKYPNKDQVYKRTPFRYISAKVAGGEIKRGIQHVSEVCKTFIPYDSNCWFFFDEQFGRMYESEQKITGFMLALSLIAVTLAGMGLLGLSIFAVEKRRKEIGIRRVFGASVSSVLFLFFRDFLYIHGVAILIGFPVIYLAINRWLSNFAYRISISPWIFIITAVLTAALFFITGSSSVIKAVATNPVDSLKYE